MRAGEGAALEIRPIRLKDARRFVGYFHRHNRAPAGGQFAISLWSGSELVGVGIAGRPIARGFDDGRSVEITRVCVKEGIPNANSMLYGRLRRIATLLGYTRIITYTLKTESGASLRAIGAKPVEATTPHSWNSQSRSRREHTISSDQEKLRWIILDAVSQP